MQTPSQQTSSVAMRGVGALGPLAERVRLFVASKQSSDGGYIGRAGGSDLYYGSFAVEILTALGVALPAAFCDYVSSFGCGTGLDFMHAACLARCWARMPGVMPAAGREELISTLEGCRSEDGNFHTVPGQRQGSATGTFLALQAFYDLGTESLLGSDRLIVALEGLRSADGGYGNEPGMEKGTTLAAAGVLTLQAWLDAPVELDVASWLVGQQHAEGGFCASSEIGMPDLLTTATVLYALYVTGQGLRGIREVCECYVDGLMEDDGGYVGHWLDDTTDLEYTYYGLVALGVLHAHEGA
jgi:hypothetical protein